MTLKDLGITEKKTDKMLVASTHFKDTFERKSIRPKLEELYEKCKEKVCGPPIALLDFGVYSDGIDVEACCLVTEPIEKDDVKSRTLEGVEVLSLTHNGPYEKIRESYQKLSAYTRSHSVVGTAFAREIYLKRNPDNPEEDVTEIQVVLHGWENRLAKNLDRVLGPEKREKVMLDSGRLFTLESTSDDHARWIKEAVERLDKLADERQKYDILSCCAHDFSQKRIADMRAIYEKTRSIDEVIKAMDEDPAWYEKPRREGNVIHVTKVPFDKTNYEKAADRDEKRKSYCHCAMVREHLKEGISPTFCYCGAGWYRQIWEGILRKPVKIEIRKSLLKGDDACQFAIYTPLD